MEDNKAVFVIICTFKVKNVNAFVEPPLVHAAEY